MKNFHLSVSLAIFVVSSCYSDVNAAGYTNNFGSNTGTLSSGTSTTFGSNSITGATQSYQIGSGGGSFLLTNTPNPLSSSGSFLRIAGGSSAPSGAVGPRCAPLVPTGATTNGYLRCTMLVGDSSGQNTATGGEVQVLMGSATEIVNVLTLSQASLGLRFSLQSGGAVALSYLSGTSWATNGLNNVSFQQGTVYTVEVVVKGGNNAGSLQYSYNGYLQTLTSTNTRVFDLYINGAKVGSNLPGGSYTGNQAAVAYWCGGSTSAHLFLDDVVLDTTPAGLDLWTSTDPVVTVNGYGTFTAGAFTATYGTPSAAQTFTVGARNLSNGISVAAPANFEVSADGGATFADSASLPTSGGALQARLKAGAPAGTSGYGNKTFSLTSGTASASITTGALNNTVSPKGLTITGLSIADKEYDRTNTASIAGSPAYAGLVSGENFSVAGTPVALFSSMAAGTNKTVTVTGYAAPSANYSVSQPSGLTASILPKAVTVSGAAVTTRVYNGSTNATITGTLTGVISGDTVALVGSGSFASANAGTGIAVTPACTLSGADAGNYLLTQPAGLTGTISKATPTVTSVPVASSITAGQTLASSILTGGAASVPGTFAFTSASLAPAAGTSAQGVTFTPTDGTNHTTATTTVNVTVLAAGGSFASWSGGAATNADLVGRYAIGGASNSTATGEIPVPTVTTGQLSISAVVRTNDSKVTVVGQVVTNLWDIVNAGATTSVNGVASTNQSGVPAGHQRQEFSVTRGPEPMKFLRLKATLNP